MALPSHNTSKSPSSQAPTSGRLRIAVVGAGRISEFHFTAWKDAGNVDVVAVCDIDPDRAGRMAERFSIAKSYGSLTELLDNERVDALDIATPPTSHAEILHLAAGRGIDCLCQKPLSRDFAESSRLIAELAPQIRLMINENRRYLPYVRMAREWIAEGLIGELQQATMTAFRASFLPSVEGVYSGTPALVSGPRLFVSEALIHQIDCLRSLLGPLNAIAARMLATEERLGGETLCTLFMETPRGAPVVLAGNSVAVGYPDRFNDRFEIHGSRASLVWDGARLRLLGPEPREIGFDTQAGYDEMYQSCFTTAAIAFRDAITTGAPFETDGADNLETLKIVEDAYRLSRARD